MYYNSCTCVCVRPIHTCITSPRCEGWPPPAAYTVNQSVSFVTTKAQRGVCVWGQQCRWRCEVSHCFLPHHVGGGEVDDLGEMEGWVNEWARCDWLVDRPGEGERGGDAERDESDLRTVNNHDSRTLHTGWFMELILAFYKRINFDWTPRETVKFKKSCWISGQNVDQHINLFLWCGQKTRGFKGLYLGAEGSVYRWSI